MTDTRHQTDKAEAQPEIPGRRILRLSHLVATAALAITVLHSNALGNQDYRTASDGALASLEAMSFGVPAPGEGLATYPAGDRGTRWVASRPTHVPEPNTAPGRRVVALTMLDAPFAADPAFPDSAREGYGLRGTQLQAEIELAKREIACLALNIYHEARGESANGRLAVAHVVMNRVADRRFPDTVCAVIRQGGERVRHRCQFSWWCDGRSDHPHHHQSWTLTKSLARDVYWGYVQDPTDGALWYHADYVSPYWRTAFQQGPTIGRHIFYKDKTTEGRGKPTQVASSE